VVSTTCFECSTRVSGRVGGSMGPGLAAQTDDGSSSSGEHDKQQQLCCLLRRRRLGKEGKRKR
jgi:hypothetical protein